MQFDLTPQSWAGGRRVGARGKLLYWFVPARPFHDDSSAGEPRQRLRQERALTTTEREFWESVSEQDKCRYGLQV